MCLIACAVEPRSDVRLVVAANRDELYDRPAAPAERWSDGSGIVAGRDLLAGGTWMGITTGGRFAAVTNVREPGVPPAQRSRGELVRGFLVGEEAPGVFAAGAVARGGSYGPFNLLAGEAGELWYASNRVDGPVRVASGVHGLSNAALDTPWPKVRQATDGLRAWLDRDGDVAELLGVLGDRDQAPDDALPSTGIPLEWERALSAPLIVTPRYGTRSSTVLVVRHGGAATFVEWTRDRDGAVSGERRFELQLPGW